MNRRSFLTRTGVGLGGLALLPAAASLVGCTVSTTTMKSYLNIVLESSKKILALSSSTDSWYPTLSSAITALETTESSWDGTTTTAAIISALDTIEAVLAVIPETSTYSALIALLVAAIEAILTTYAAKTTSAVRPKAIAMANPYRGRITLKQPHFMQSRIGAFKSQWNETVDANPKLAGAKL